VARLGDDLGPGRALPEVGVERVGPDAGEDVGAARQVVQDGGHDRLVPIGPDQAPDAPAVGQ
jgi:hypothetical protein